LRWKLRHALKLPRLLPFLLGGLIGLPVGVALLRWAPAADLSDGTKRHSPKTPVTIVANDLDFV